MGGYEVNVDRGIGVLLTEGVVVYVIVGFVVGVAVTIFSTAGAKVERNQQKPETDYNFPTITFYKCTYAESTQYGYRVLTEFFAIGSHL